MVLQCGPSRATLIARLGRSGCGICDCCQKRRASSRARIDFHRKWAPGTKSPESRPLNNSSTSIAVLGGGITGVAATLWLGKLLPKAKITLFESSQRLGGWIKSTKHKVDGHEVIFEQGPRSLRPSLSFAGAATDQLLKASEQRVSVLPTSKQSAAAANRYIYYPDRLAHMPNPRNGILPALQDMSAPIFDGVRWAPLMEYWRPGRDPSLSDESVGSFIRRRFSAAMADKLVSAILHGIYAGDIDRLSVRTLMPSLWWMEQQYTSLAKGSILNSLERRQVMPRNDLNFLFHLASPDLRSLVSSTSVYTMEGGVEQLIKGCIETIRSKCPNVIFRHGTRITELAPTAENPHSPVSLPGHSLNLTNLSLIRVSWSWSKDKTDSAEFTHAVSALPSKPLLAALSNKDSKYPVLEPADINRFATPSVTVMVVNLYYTDPELVPYHGFGYLLPRALPYEQNPEFALGVVFDSDATPHLDKAPGTKLTVMLGGHWWDGWDAFPSESEGIGMAKSLLQRQLGIKAEPELAIATLQKDCIPQYHVGHHERAAALGKKLNQAFGNRLEVAGASWHGVSVNDCIKSAYMSAINLESGLDFFSGLARVDWVGRQLLSVTPDSKNRGVYSDVIELKHR